MQNSSKTMELECGSRCPSGDFRASIETTNRRSESGSHILTERGPLLRASQFDCFLSSASVQVRLYSAGQISWIGVLDAYCHMEY